MEVGWGYSARPHRSRPHNQHRCNTRPLADKWAHPNSPCSTVRYRRNRYRHRPPPAGNRTGHFPHRLRYSIHPPSNTDRGSGNRVLRRSRCHSSRRRRSTRLLENNNLPHRQSCHPDSNTHSRTAFDARDNSVVSAQALGDGRHRSLRSRFAQWQLSPQFPADPGVMSGENHLAPATEPAHRTGDHPRFTPPQFIRYRIATDRTILSDASISRVPSERRVFAGSYA